MPNEKEGGGLIKVGSLWVNKSAKGEKYYSGNLGSMRLLLFRSKSDHPQAPTYNLFIAQRDEDKKGWKKRGEDEDEGQPTSRRDKDEDDDDDDKPAKKKSDKDEDDDDLPF